MQQKPGSLLTGAAAAIVILFFFLPWVTVSCQGVEESLTGYDMAVGKSSDESSDTEAEADEPLWLIPLAGVVALGLLFGRSFIQISNSNAAGIIIAAGVIGLIVQFLKYLAIQSDMDEAEQQIGGGLITISYELGWWLTMLGLIGLIVGGIMVFREGNSPEPIQMPTARTQPPPY